MWSTTLVQHLVDSRDLGRSDHKFNVIETCGVARVRLFLWHKIQKYLGSKLYTLSCDDTRFQLALNVASAV
jgi:hypothetical protein